MGTLQRNAQLLRIDRENRHSVLLISLVLLDVTSTATHFIRQRKRPEFFQAFLFLVLEHIQR